MDKILFKRETNKMFNALKKYKFSEIIAWSILCILLGSITGWAGYMWHLKGLLILFLSAVLLIMIVFYFIHEKDER